MTQVLIRGLEYVSLPFPTPLSPDAGPDLSVVEDAANTSAPLVRGGSLVILRSAAYPVTSQEVIVPTLQSSRLTARIDFLLALCPERIDLGSVISGLTNTPKVVDGLAHECGEAAASFYKKVVDRVVIAKCRWAAKLTKLAEKTYRQVNIASMSEAAKFCHELDIGRLPAIRGASTKPFDYQPSYPEPGIRRHRIRIDPNCLNRDVKRRLGQPFRFVGLAKEINLAMPVCIGRRSQVLLNRAGKALSGAHLYLLGGTYKADIADQSESPAKALRKSLLGAGAQVTLDDQSVVEGEVSGAGMPLQRSSDSAFAVSEVDVIVLLQTDSPFDLGSACATAGRPVFHARGVPVRNPQPVERL